MKRNNWWVYGGLILLVEAVGALSAWLSGGMDLYDTLVLPPLSPPGVVFPIVWTVLFALLGIGTARVYLAPPSPLREKALWVFAIQLLCNFLWSIFFFRFQVFGFALLWLALLWVLILWMTVLYLRVQRWAGLIQIPYLLWVTFAGYLNFGVWRLN